jgi:hypothetical protein
MLAAGLCVFPSVPNFSGETGPRFLHEQNRTQKYLYERSKSVYSTRYLTILLYW